MSVTTVTPAKLLEEWLASGHAQSRYTQALEIERAQGFTPYGKAYKSGDHAAAHGILEERQRLTREVDYAAGIEPVVKGMLALAGAQNGKYAETAEITPETPFQGCVQINTPSKLVAVFNPEDLGRGCPSTVDSDVFGYYGSLNLRAVTFQVGWNEALQATLAALTLILPVSDRSVAEGGSDSGFSTIEIRSDGHTNASGQVAEVKCDTYFRYALGLTPLSDVLTRTSGVNGATFDARAGFPGATEFFAQALPRLGNYLVATAAKLDASHTH